MKIYGNIQPNVANEIASYVVDTGAADAYVVTLRPAILSYTTGLKVRFQATNTNTGASTINVNGLGTKSIKKGVSTTLSAGDITANQIITIVYDGTNFQMQVATSGGGGLTTADNGLTANTSTNVQLGATSNAGSPLLHNTWINTGSSYTLTIEGSATVGTTAGILYVKNTASGGNAIYGLVSDGRAVYGTASTSGVGIYGLSDSGIGVYGNSTSSWGGYFQSTTGLGSESVSQPSSTNTIVPIIRLTRGTSGTAANGIGGSFDFNLETTVANYVSNQLISKWTDATEATRTSQFIITGVNSATTVDLITFSGNGAVVIPGTGTPGITLYALNTTGTGVRGDTTSGNAVYGVATTGIGGQFNTTSGSAAIQGFNAGGVASNLTSAPSSTNTVQTVLNINRGSSGTPANGIGASIDFGVSTTTTVYSLSNKITSKWVDATHASRTSSMIFTGINSTNTVNLLTLSGNGSMLLEPITATAASAITAAEGMLVFVSSTNGTFTSIGLWCYENGAWSKK